MIPITLTVRPTESRRWLAVVRHHFRRFEFTQLDEIESLMWIPQVGTILVTDGLNEIRLQAIASDNTKTELIMVALANEISAAVPEIVSGSRLRLQWTFPRCIPAQLRS
jgi:hypothetical protein